MSLAGLLPLKVCATYWFQRELIGDLHARDIENCSKRFSGERDEVLMKTVKKKTQHQFRVVAIV